MGGLDKILSIKQMSEQKLIDMVKEMPDLEDIEKSIKKHIEEKKKEKPKDSNKSKSKSKPDMSETIDFDLSVTSSCLTLSINESLLQRADPKSP